MARKQTTRRSSRDTAAPEASKAVRDSAQKIWLAGLGAFERAKSDGPRVFDALVEQGRSLGAKAADSLVRLGVTTTREVETLTRQVQDLSDTVRGMATAAIREGRTAKPKAKRAKANAKRAAKAKVKRARRAVAPARGKKKAARR